MSWGEVEAILNGALVEGLGSANELVVRYRGDTVYRRVAGLARKVPTPRALPETPWWDLASVTKVLAGTAVTWALIDEGLIDFDAPANDWVPEAAPGVTIAHLLSHSSGYPPWRKLYEVVAASHVVWGSAEARALVLHEAATTTVLAGPGEAYAYSDLGFLTLCGVLEAAGGDRLDRLWADRVARDWSGLAWGVPPENSIATEDCPFRGRMIEGEVHDLNCASMGGSSTHAGLFGTGEGVVRAGESFLRAFQRGEGAISRAWRERGAGSHWLGWDGRTPGASSSGQYFPSDSAGHLGYTGTSIWVAPSWELVVALLTNRVHPSVEDQRIKSLRPRVHDAVARALGLT